MLDKGASEGLPGLPERFRLTPEFRLLAACSWVAPALLEQAQKEKIDSLCHGEIDWEAFLALVERHRVPSLAYATLSRYTGDGIPHNVREKLQQRNRQERMQALLQAAELVRLIKLFTEQGIDVLPLKGVFLSHQLYDDLGMRSFGDLDIMVKPEHVDQAARILLAEGYYCDWLGMALTARQEQQIREQIHHLSFAHAERGLHLELHRNFGPWLPEQVAMLLHHTQLQEWQGSVVNYLDNDALLLLLCDHGARHEWFRLKWLSDVARLLAAARVTSWESLFALARRLDLQRTLAHSALLVHWIYDIPLPAQLYELIGQEKLIASLSTRAMAAILKGEKELTAAGAALRVARQMKQLRPSLPYSVLLKSVMTSGNDWQMIPLPDALFWLYYPLRPFLWFYRHYIRK